MEKEIQSNIVFIEQPGGPEVLKLKKVMLDRPGKMQVLISQKAIGVNFLDTFFRSGAFPSESYPAQIGLEAAGIIEEVGSDVEGFNVGDRVAYYASNGAYADKRIININEIFRLPDEISYEQAAAVMIKGLTVHMLIKQNHKVQAGEVVLIHAMTGGVGTLLSEWVRDLGATVIGTVGSASKKELAQKRGFQYVIDLGSQDFVEEIKKITHGNGVDVVYDSIGLNTFHQSLTVLKEGGSAVLYGWASGMPDTNDDLIKHKNIRFSQAVLNNYPLYKDKSGKGLQEIFDLLTNGVHSEKPSEYPLAQASKAHSDLESRKTTGSIILKP